MPPPDSPLTALRAYLAWDDAANLRLNEDDLRGLAGLED